MRDPIHKLITFENNNCDKLLLELINTREFQRLRRIKQLGMTELTFPQANHSRFAHSLGVIHTARRFLERLEIASGKEFSEEQKIIVLAAALLHDIGHGPFSHTFEAVTKLAHEALTLRIIQDPDTEVHNVLKEYSSSLPEQLVHFFEQDADTTNADESVPAYLTHVVASQLDSDRADYLLRDSYATGADYGQFDLDWLIAQLNIDTSGKGPDRLFISAKGLSVVEAYIFARYHMYRTVYYHKSTRSAEVMLQQALRRFKDLAEAGHADVERIKEQVPIIARALENIMTEPKAVGLEDYLLLDDGAIVEFLKSTKYAKDRTLRALGLGLVNRRLLKAQDASGRQRADALVKFEKVVEERARMAGFDPRYMVFFDKPGDTPYKPYDPDSEKSATQIYIETSPGRIEEISRVSNTVSQLTQRYNLARFYHPAEIRADLHGEFNAIFGRSG